MINLSGIKFNHEGAYIENEKEITIFMQRQGISIHKGCAHPRFYVETGIYIPTKKFIYAVHYSNNKEMYGNMRGQIFKQNYSCETKQEAIQQAQNKCSELTEKQVVIHIDAVANIDKTLSEFEEFFSTNCKTK